VKVTMDAMREVRASSNAMVVSGLLAAAVSRITPVSSVQLFLLPAYFFFLLGYTARAVIHTPQCPNSSGAHAQSSPVV